MIGIRLRMCAGDALALVQFVAMAACAVLPWSFLPMWWAFAAGAVGILACHLVFARPIRRLYGVAR